MKAWSSVLRNERSMFTAGQLLLASNILNDIDQHMDFFVLSLSCRLRLVQIKRYPPRPTLLGRSMSV